MKESLEFEDKKYFTLTEANKQLPLIKKSLIKLRKIEQELAVFSLVDVQVDEFNESNAKTITKLNKDFHKLNYEFYKLIEEIESTGCILKDISKGLVDFYAKDKDKEILLCWQMGEESIQFFHDIENGYDGRKHISLLGV